MKRKILAKRYAEGLLSYAKNTIGLQQAVEELKNLKFIFKDNPEFKQFLESLEFTYQEKSQAIDKTLKDFSEEVRQFVKLLIEKERIKYLIQIADYVRITYGRDGEIDCLLKTSYPLSLDLVRRIKEQAENRFKKKLNLFLELDANLLGGVKLIVGNTVLDGSVRGRLEDLRARLRKVRV